jgi:hypothetical protein
MKVVFSVQIVVVAVVVLQGWKLGMLESINLVFVPGAAFFFLHNFNFV